MYRLLMNEVLAIPFTVTEPTAGNGEGNAVIIVDEVPAKGKAA